MQEYLNSVVIYNIWYLFLSQVYHSGLTGCIDETGQCYLENATKQMDNSCLKYKCYEDRIMRLEGKVLSHRPDMEQNGPT